MIQEKVKATYEHDPHDLNYLIGKNVSFINPYSYMQLRGKNLVRNIDYLYVDGILLSLIFSLFRIRNTRISFDFTSLAPIVLNYCITNKLNILFIGGSKNDTENFKNNLMGGYPSLNLNVLNGYDYNSSNYIKKIQKIKPDIIVVGMGSPKQDELIALFSSQWKATYFTCGGFITQTSKQLIYYPEIINKFNLRFIFRFLKEKHYRKRLFLYLLYLPRILSDCFLYILR